MIDNFYVERIMRNQQRFIKGKSLIYRCLFCLFSSKIKILKRRNFILFLNLVKIFVSKLDLS